MANSCVNGYALASDVHNKELRELLLRHYKDDGKTPYTFEEQLSRAKSWEAAHNTNIAIMHSANSKMEEQIHHLTNKSKCGWCGGPRHTRKECPATRPGTYCTNCYMTENHFAKVCRSPKDKFKVDFEKRQRKPTNTKRPPTRRGNDVHQLTEESTASAAYPPIISLQ
ncbi:hypothetical protein OS493_031079 [Desmophyllum pertusum]|uniref:CCHC-type domain-containing protein n=1 Tax=Desmophyllum pertusum TaxID=174260 RepID=A0A9W9YMY7_9CNID|nr:hypothetical protein OS493_031079 [Desmophyllum pertusum]